jgi:hypothetical protein
MKTNAPQLVTWWIALILGVLGIVTQLKIVAIPALAGYGFWLVTIAFVVLILATILKGL